MDKKKNVVSVTIGGEPYKLKGDQDTERVQRVAQYLDERLRQTERAYPQLSPVRTAVLTGLNLADDYLQLQEDYQQLLAMVRQTR